MENPDPLTEPALTVTAPVPDDVIVTDCVAGVLSWTLPNVTLVELNVSVGVLAFSVRVKVFATPPADAVSVAV